jgi:DNA helicase II / ATP-dependent DNA helicase PcrA
VSWNDGLSGTALLIAETEESPLRVMAGPGTGKTFAMKRRVMRLLEEEKADPRRILAITFTRTAAADLVNELRNLGVPGCETIVASTLHSYCFSLLNRAEVFDFLGRTPRPLITFKTSGVLRFEAAPLLEDLDNAELYGDKRSRTKRILAFEAAWARLQSDEPGWTKNAVDEQFETDLIRWMKFHSTMLVGELVPQALTYLRANPACLDLGAFDHVLVDEYQDLNKAEQVLLDVLSDSAKSMVVGDKDQSIYSFRHAHPEGIVEYAVTHPETHDEPLTECRRCPKRVVAIADSLIRRNYPPGSGCRLHPLATNGEGEIKMVQWHSMEQEAAGIAAFVKNLIAERGYSARDIMVLSPRRLIGYGIRDALVKQEIAVHSFYHEEMLEGSGTQRAFTLLTLLNNKQDRVALRFWLGYGSSSWRTGAYMRLLKHCEETGQSPWDALQDIESGKTPIKGVKELLTRFKDLKEELTALAPLTGQSLVDYLFPEEQADNAAIREAGELAGASTKDSKEILRVLTSVITQPAMPEAGEFVRVMSLHKSKGLTSKIVIVAGFVEGLIPFLDKDHSVAEEKANLEEQRRLLYVAVTRATDILVISSFATIERKVAHKIGARVKKSGGNKSHALTESSRFLKELGPTAPPGVAGPKWVLSKFS